MIYLELFLGFLQVGCFSFGGAYAAIPLIRDVVLSYGWLSEETLLYFIAVAESTPGPIIVNLATYVGSSQGGILGAALATLTVILPALILILIIVSVMDRFLKNPWVKAIMDGLKPCVAGIVLAIGGYMLVENLYPQTGVQWQSLVITGILAALSIASHALRKKKVAPIPMIIIAAVLGIAVYGIPTII